MSDNEKEKVRLLTLKDIDPWKAITDKEFQAVRIGDLRAAAREYIKFLGDVKAGRVKSWGGVFWFLGDENYGFTVRDVDGMVFLLKYFFNLEDV